MKPGDKIPFYNDRGHQVQFALPPTRSRALLPHRSHMLKADNRGMLKHE
jgi:hypothetical protein